MPELPEVETVVQGLSATTIGQSILDIQQSHKKMRRNPCPILLNKIIDNYIINVTRRAKYIIITFSNNLSLIIHLGMSGTLIIEEKSAVIATHTHLILNLANNYSLRLIDPRRFGMIEVIANDDLPHYNIFSRLGPEPLTAEFNSEYLYNCCQRYNNRNLKSLIMDQVIVVGVGNIYACESLFAARLSPFKLGKNCTPQELQRLVESIKNILENAIRNKGTTLKDYRTLEGDHGTFQLLCKVYGRKDKSCIICSNNISNIKLSGRSTFFCNNCQKDE